MSQPVFSRVGCLGAAILAFMPWSAFCQPPQDLPRTNIRVQVNEVIVPVTVTDDKNRFVSNLDAKDFRVFDEGKEQKLQFFSRDQKQPVVVGFILDIDRK